MTVRQKSSLWNFYGRIYEFFTNYPVSKRFFGGVLVAHLFSFSCCPIMCLYVFSFMLWCPLRFQFKNNVFTYSCLQECSCLYAFFCVCLFAHSGVEKEFVDTKGIIRIRKSKKNRQHNGQMEKGQKNKQRSTKHYT